MDADFLASLARRYPPARKYLVGVSGGRDSVALLHALREAGFRRLVVCHLNHGLRGRASGEDARFTRRLAERWGFPVEVEKVPVARIALRRKLSLETAAREERHAFFARLSGKHRCQRLFLAHHADDQVETVLHHLFRGAGLAGLAGMAAESEIAAGPRGLRLLCLRPLLGVWRREIDAYLARHGLPSREDASNASGGGSTRNRWRHQLIPALAEALERDPRPAVLRLAEIAREEDQALELWLDREWDSLGSAQGQRLLTRPLLDLPPALQRRALRRWLAGRGVPEISFDLVERLRAILPSSGAAAAKVNLPGGGHARRRAGELFFQSGDRP